MYSMASMNGIKNWLFEKSGCFWRNETEQSESLRKKKHETFFVLYTFSKQQFSSKKITEKFKRIRKRIEIIKKEFLWS